MAVPGDWLNKAREATAKAGGTLSGALNAGQFMIAIPLGSFRGPYSFSGGTLKIKIDEKPFLVPCKVIEGYLRSEFGAIPDG